ncbi:MAG: 2-C-methyl-D-erythritol 4-phosphate cytidylyltransferase, partial [Planctomycetota bacterium]
MSGAVAVILVAAGRSTRFAASGAATLLDKKPFVPLAGKPVWRHAAERFARRDDVAQLVLVLSPEDREAFNATSRDAIAELSLTVCDGGSERADSVRAGLDAIHADGVTHVAVHDAARPCVADDEIDRVFAAAIDAGAALLAAPVTATLKRSSAEGRVAETVPRDG